MDGFSDIESSSRDVGSEVTEVETPNADFGDGDGVNDFDDTYESMNNGDEIIEYSSENTMSPEPVENNNEGTETTVDEQLNDFDDVDETTEQTETPDVAPAGDNVEQSPSEMTTDENVDEVLSDFDDEDDIAETDTEEVKDETTETDTADEADETSEDDTEDTSDGNAESDADEVTDETSEDDTEDTAEETSEANSNGDNSETDDTYSKSDISPELKNSLEKFEQEKWERMSLEEQGEAIIELRDSVATDLRLENKPEVKFYNVPDNTDFGGYSAKENAIYINEYNMGDAHETADTIAHESRHCWQHERAENPQTEQDLVFKENFDDYVSPSDDYQEYKNQPVEVDARQYAADVCQNIGEYSDDFSTNGNMDVDEGNVEAYRDLSPERGAVFDNRPEDLESKVEVLPISKKASERCEEAGLSQDKVQEIREIPNGDKPNPDEYLSKDYIDNHLSKFEESGCYKIISDKRGEPIGTIGDEGVFVLNGEDVEKMIKDADGDPRKLEEALAMKPGYLGEQPYIIRCDEPHNLRMATGNEPNAWQDEWCPCGVTRDGTNEAVIDPMEKGEYSFKHVFGDDEWCK